MVLKKCLVLLLIGISFCALPVKPHTFISTTNVKASEWNANEDELFGAITDGLMDLEVVGVSGNYFYSSPATTYYKVVSPLELIPVLATTVSVVNSSSTTYNEVSTTYNLYLKVAKAGTLNAAIYIPNDSTITALQTSCNTTNIVFTLYRHEVATGVHTALVTFNSTQSCSITTVSSANSYYLRAQNNSLSETQIWWVLLTYTRNKLGLVY